MGGVGWCLQSHFIVKPNLVLRLGWGFDKNIEERKEMEKALGLDQLADDLRQTS